METEADQKVVQCIFSKLQWEIGEERIEDDLARVTVRITAAPYDEMVLAYQTHVEENLESYRANYQDLGEEEYQKAILEDRLDFYRSYGNTVTTTIEMDLVYQEEHWVVSHCEGFSDALLGVQP